MEHYLGFSHGFTFIHKGLSFCSQFSKAPLSVSDICLHLTNMHPDVYLMRINVVDTCGSHCIILCLLFIKVLCSACVTVEALICSIFRYENICSHIHTRIRTCSQIYTSTTDFLFFEKIQTYPSVVTFKRLRCVTSHFILLLQAHLF